MPAPKTYYAIQNEDAAFDAVTATTISGSTSLSANTIAEYTAASGVTIDGVLLKDGQAYNQPVYVVASADGAITPRAYDQRVFITKGTAAALTLADPTPTTHDGASIVFIATTAAAHTVSNAAGSGFFSTGGSGKDVATFGGAIGDGFACFAYQGKWYIDPRGVTNVTLG